MPTSAASTKKSGSSTCFITLTLMHRPHPACEQLVQHVQNGQRRYEGLMPTSAASVPSYEQLQRVPPSFMSSDTAITDDLPHFRSLSSSSNPSMSSSNGLSVSENNQAAAESAAAESCFITEHQVLWCRSTANKRSKNINNQQQHMLNH